jgi:hypothetical protein
LSRGNLEEAREQAAEAARIDGTRVDAFAVLAEAMRSAARPATGRPFWRPLSSRGPDDLLL